mgnify:CR=1 FL=1
MSSAGMLIWKLCTRWVISEPRTSSRSHFPPFRLLTFCLVAIDLVKTYLCMAVSASFSILILHLFRHLGKNMDGKPVKARSILPVRAYACKRSYPCFV